MKHKLYEILNMLKGFEVGYNSRVENKLLVDYKKERYVITFQKVKKISEDMSEDIDYYL